MVFALFSDHGLSYEHKGESYTKLTHNDQFKQNFEVPLFILSSDSHEKYHITAKRNGRYFMTLFSEWIGIQDPKISNHCHMISMIFALIKTRLSTFKKKKSIIIHYQKIK